MREQLKNMEEIRDKFIGTFVKFGIKKGYFGPEKTILLKNIRNSEDKFITDHLWFNLTKGFEKLELIENDKISFNARVKEYTKGYFGPKEDVYKEIEIDYKLSHPTKINKI
jgi:hypothetical protein